MYKGQKIYVTLCKITNMSKVVFVLAVLTSSLTSFSQDEGSFGEKRVKYGFNLGVNYSNLLHKEALPENASLSNDFGFRLGILADYRLSEIVSISPKAELSFNNSSVHFAHTDGTSSEYRVMPVSLDLMTHFVFKANREKLSPYFLFGPNVKIPISKRSDNSAEFSTNSDLAIDCGIGIDRAGTSFNFSPELRYSFGLLNVNQQPSVQSLRFHMISLVFNFVG